MKSDLHKIPLKFYNTESRKKEEFHPIVPGKVLMYTCGPTVYDFAHIGNFRTYIFEDILVRTLKFFGYQVCQVMNLTDVDDKTIKGAIAKKISLNEYTKPFKEAFFQDIETLGITAASEYPEATKYIPEMIAMIEDLLSKKKAYVGLDGSIYYAIRECPHYGRLSHLHLDELQAGASNRVAADEYEKETVCDFVLWKKYDEVRDGGIFWESPFRKGRPGWHLECSAMAIALLGETIDIHVGGVDNIFPHHENEIAQSEGCTGHTFVNLWMHSEHLLVDHKKMSKSLGNFYTLRNLLEKGFTGMQVRYLLLQTHYRTQLNFTLQGLDAAKASLYRLHDLVDRLKKIDNALESNKDVPRLIEGTLLNFAQALADDLNISQALAALFDFVREINTLCNENLIAKRDVEPILEILKKIDSVLGVIFSDTEEKIPEEIEALLVARESARKAKEWQRSDALRQEIHDKGYVIEDTNGLPRLKKR